MSILVVHGLLANTVWMFFLALGIWGLWRALRGEGIDGSYLGGMAIGQILFVLQAVLGGYLWFAIGTAGMARPGIHLLYGIFALVFLPFMYFVVLKGDASNRAQWVMAFATFFLFGIALRSIGTAAG